MTLTSSNEAIVTVNPQVAGFFGTHPLRGRTISLINSRLRTVVEMQPASAVEILKCASAPVSKFELSKRICARLEIPESEARRYMDDLIDSEVLIDASKAKRTIWEDYNRKEAGLFYFLSRDQAYLDEEIKSDSTHIRSDTLRSYLKENPPPPVFKRMSGPSIALPQPAVPTDQDLAHLLLNRKTVRKFSGKSISLDTLSGLLSLSLGRTRNQRLAYQRNVNSDPAVLLQSMFCAFELYLCVHRVDGLDSGLYHYDLENHALTKLRSGDTENQVYDFIWGQPMARKSAVSFFISTVFERYAWRYRYSKAYGNLLVSLGECAQSIIMAASAYKLGSCMTPALRDQQVDSFIGLDRSVEQVMYFLGVGQFDSKVSQVVS